MDLYSQEIARHNASGTKDHEQKLENILSVMPRAEQIITQLMAFQVAVPSWALGTGGTRFGRFPGGGEPRSLEEKIADVGLLHALTRAAGSISLHIPWDIPKDPESVKKLASGFGLKFDAVNSNTFQDQPGQALSYKFGSLQHVDPAVRRQAVEHNLQVIRIGQQLGSSALTVWLSDGSSYPGQLDFRKAFERTLEGLRAIYEGLPQGWKMFIEYKAFEPHFYSTTVGDWGQSFLYASKLGPKAFSLVDLGHHLPNANIEQIVALLLMEKRLGGFHFNDSKYGDDDLTVGSIRPYQLFLIFHELVKGLDALHWDHAGSLGWMIDASHNLKDPLEDLIQSLEAIRIAYCQALLVDQEALEAAQSANDPALAQEILQGAYRTDVRPLVAEASRRSGGALMPLTLFREQGFREKRIIERGRDSVATGL